ncbi:MAG: acylneuraminate cytidylyltransferase, partial [Spirochaeta sp.]|nr:acylneuraminate cytidylyltransferase [Spirochaeta sp.]
MGSTRVGVFLQARLGSTRLPRKVLLPLKGGNVLQHALRSLRKIKADVYALLTDHSSGGILEQYAIEEGFSLFM